VLPPSLTSAEWHLRNFEALARSLEGRLEVTIEERYPCARRGEPPGGGLA